MKPTDTEKTRQQIGRIMDLEEAHELCLSGFHNPKAHGLLKEWPEESKKELYISHLHTHLQRRH
jgi:hypothetical protein